MPAISWDTRRPMDGTSIKLSVRSERKELDAGELVRAALTDIGSGGGHKGMAGGYIPSEKAALLGTDLHGEIEKRFLREIEKG